METERDTHFAGAAECAARKLKEQNLLDIGNHVKPLVDPPIDVEYEEVKLILAQFAYDLVEHALVCHSVNKNYWPHGPLYGLLKEKAEALFRAEIIAATNEIPDLTTWPTDPGTS